jgi:ATPase family protein associated with various cellular activities (AAA)
MTVAHVPEVAFTPGVTIGDSCAAAWMQQVTLRLRREVSWRWHQRGVAQPDVGRLTPTDGASPVQESLDRLRYWDARRSFFETDVSAAYLTRKIGATAVSNTHPTRGSFGWVVETLALDDVASFALAMGLVARFDAAAGPVLAACQGDSTRTEPSLALVQRLWDAPERCLGLADPTHALWRYGLLQSSRGAAIADWDAAFAVAPLVAERLLTLEASPRLARIEGDPERLTEVMQPLVDRLAAPARGLRVLPMRGQRGVPYAAVAGALAAAAGREVCLPAATAVAEPASLQSVLTLAWLCGVDILLEDEASSPEHDSVLSQLSAARALPITVYLAMLGQRDLATLPRELTLPPLMVAPLSYDQRVTRLRTGLADKALGLEDALAEAGRRFRYEAETLDGICAGLAARPGPLTAQDLFAACRSAIPMQAGELAQPVRPRFRPDELALPAPQQKQFDEIERAMRSLTRVHYGWGTGRVWNESGISVLFAGPSGTGKTMAAEVLAAKLDIPMFRINLSQVVNKYIGETEKNLERVFDAADVSETLLFFDEADALFGRRTEVRDAHDRYANLEISYLLERMERFKGLAVLATNRRGDLDEAFLRRLRYVVEFPLPDAPQRLEIWRRVVPRGVDAAQLDFEFLARQFQLSGGNIRSAVFNACLQAAADQPPAAESKPQLTMDEVVIAIKREYDKLQRSVNLGQFGQYARVVQAMTDD